MEERDLLKEMFECYFRFRKMNSELPPDRLLDAIIGALSGADYPKIVREDLLRNLIADCDTIKETTKRVKTLREQALNVVTAPIAIIQDKKLTSSDWLEIDEVCKEFKLPKNNIKSKKWRDDNNFPYRNPTGGKLSFNRNEVEEWLKADKH